MSEEKPNVPKLRFPGFADPWEQRKALHLASYSKGKGYSKDDLTESGTPVILYGRLYTKYESVIEEVDTFVDASNDGIYSHGDEVIVPASGETAEDIARASAVAQPGVLLGGDLNILRPNRSITSLFMALSLSNGTAQKELSKRAQGKSVVHVHNSDIQDVTISYPTIDEQTQIGAFFRSLDSLITLHQRKLDHLKEMKKGLLQKMFPKNGESIPELRFPGFTDPWEQRKALHLASYSKGKGYSKDDLTESGTPVILYGRLYTKYESVIEEVDTFVDASNDGIYSHGDEVIVPASGETAEDIARASAVAQPGVLLGGDLNILRPNRSITSLFMALSLSNGTAQKELSKRAQGKSVVHVHNSDIQDVTISYPTIDEQTQIGAFFRSLDSLITLHQRKLDHLKQMKKGLLQQMFV